MVKRTLLSFAIWFSITVNFLAFAQKFTIIPSVASIDTGWLGSDAEKLRKMNVRYTKPAGFREDQHLECFENAQKMKHTFTCLSNRLIADDGEVIIYAPIYRILTEQDSIRINRLFNGSIKSLNQFHTYVFKHELTHLRPELAENWRDYLNYYSSEDAKLIFNADTAMSCSFVLNKEDSYQGKYPNFYSLIIQKRNKGYLQLIVFYSDRAKATFERRRKDLEGVFHYQD